MVHPPAWRRYLRFWRPDPAADVADELRTHLELRVEELRAGGLTDDAARARAVEEFGDVEATRARLVSINVRMARRRARFLWWDAVRADLRYAVRGLRRTPGFTVAVVLTLAVGIGAATTMYGVMQRLLVRPPPHVAEPERVARLHFTFETPGESPGVLGYTSYAFYEHAAREARDVATVAAFADAETVTLGRGAAAEPAKATMVSAGFQRVTGVRPLLGRWMLDHETHPATGARVLVLGHEFWKRRFGGSDDVVGRVLAVKGLPYEIVGVAPRGFRGVALSEVDVWLPLRAYEDGGSRAPTWHTYETSSNLAVAARLAPGVSQARAEVAFARLFANFEQAATLRSFGADPSPGVRAGARVASVTGALDASMQPIPEARVSVWLVAVAGALLLVACANVAGLLLLRALRRRREIVVRLALGMSRRRLGGLLLVESGLLAVVGGVAAMLVVVWGGALVRRVLLDGLAVEVAVDRGAVLAAVACTLGVACVTGMVPLLHLRDATVGALRDGTQHGTVRRSPLFATLLVAQTALSVTLLIGAGLFVRSVQRVVALDHGLDVHGVLTVQVDFAGSGRRGVERAAFFERALERARGLPGVRAASVAQGVPMRGGRGIGVATSAGGDWIRAEDGGPVVNDVADGFVDASGMTLREGRDFTAADRTGPPVVVVNERLARLAWPGKSAIGECAYISSARETCATVVGVVADARTFRALELSPRPHVYAPLAPDDGDVSVLLVRAAPGTDPRALAPAITRALLDLDPALPRADVRLLADALDPELRPWRLGATIFTAFGVLAALLAALGLYAAVAYAVTQRTREIGVRRAVGAPRRHLVWLVLRDGLAIALAGTGLGALLALAGGARIADLLFDVSPRDPLVFGGVAAILVLVALVASVVPARRAARVDPIVALRAD